MMSGMPANTENVVFLTNFQKDTRFAACAQVEAYWEAARDGRDMPSRYDVDPRGMADALSHSFIGDILAPGIAKLRIAGSGLNDILGMEVRGMPLTSFFSATGRKAVNRAVERALAMPSVQALYLGAETGLGKPVLEAKMMLLPLKTETGARTRLLGVLEPIGQIGRAPRRFDVCRTDERMIRLTLPSAGQRTFQNTPINAFTETAETFVFHENENDDAARAHLRLVHSLND